MNRYLDVAPEVQEALKAGKPVVALESTIISHGMPYPQNVETALNVEKIIRDNGAVPATIAIIKARSPEGRPARRRRSSYLGKTGAGGRQGQPPRPARPGRPRDGRRHHRDHHHDDRRHGGHLACLPPAASAACTAAPRPPWTSPPIWRSWRRPR